MNTALQIKAHVEIIGSKFDIYGNRYWGFRYTDNETGKTVEGKISGGESNVTYALRAEDGMGFEWNEFKHTTVELPIRQFNRTVKGWEYAGCSAKQIAAFIREGLE